jgi:hypothetical protein
VKRISFDPCELTPGWLDLNDPAQKLFGECLHRGLVHARFGQTPASFYLMDGESARECARAATELHEMCLAATAEVLRRSDLLERFDIEPVHWERIRRSFAANHPSLTGRFDLGEAGSAFKLFEYNADSAATLIESSQRLRAQAGRRAVRQKHLDPRHRRGAHPRHRRGIAQAAIDFPGAPSTAVARCVSRRARRVNRRRYRHSRG